MRVVFVCTGNICRSPTAEAIAREMHATNDVAFTSGGIGAAEGRPMTVEAAVALTEIGIDGSGHRSRRVFGAIDARADVIYGMEPVHVTWLARHHPALSELVALLDPDGFPVTDPYGLTAETYVATRDHIAHAVAQRALEWN